MKSPHNVIQLSRLQAPVIGKGRPYTVDFGIAKPLYKQLLSKCSTALITRSKASKLLIWGLISIYTLAGISLIPSGRIVYAQPLTPLPEVQPLAMLTVPVLATQTPLESILYPVTSNLPNLYAYGNCTAYVASKLPVPGDWGNAISWGDSAMADGYTVSDVPKVGSIAWNTTDSYLGHVALVEAVDGDQVTVSEMNYQGLGIVDTRIANPGEFRYIYL